MLIKCTWENPWSDSLFRAACQVSALGAIAVTGRSLVDDAITLLLLQTTLTYRAVKSLVLFEA